MIQFIYRKVVGALFHVEESFARSHLPAGLHPLDFRLGSAICSLMVFDFVDSEVGPYTELAMTLYVPPDARPGEPMPEVGIFPWILATSTEPARRLAAERLSLPGYPRDVGARFESDGTSERVEVFEGEQPILSLQVEKRNHKRTERLFQCFTRGSEGLLQSPVTMAGGFAEHEEELGRLELFDHPLVAALDRALDDEVPFREQVADAGQQTFRGMERWR